MFDFNLFISRLCSDSIILFIFRSDLQKIFLNKNIVIKIEDKLWSIIMTL